uniref:Ribosomal protein L29 n=1 Tax=Nitzschia sp. IriIs04 TaxID=1444690 RepID=A0A0S3QPQ5_9STRA|nr:ribosomal protein L29 [Nitzschia sp. IriIs04]BAT70303.1 ribosomal protein L29 [Nitzschia sp. IriIs04]
MSKLKLSTFSDNEIKLSLLKKYSSKEIKEEILRIKNLIFIYNYKYNFIKQLLKIKYYNTKILKKRILRLENILKKKNDN